MIMMGDIKMKKTGIYMVVVLMVLLTACGTNAQSSTTTAPNATSTAATPTTAPKTNGKAIELNYAFFAPANTFPAKQMEKWKEELEKRTNGQVKVNLFPGGTLLNDKDMYNGVKNKAADIGLSATTYEPGRFPLLSISDLPSGYPNAKVASQVIYDLIKQYPPDAFKDYKIITAFATEPAYIQMKTSIANLNDLKGKQIRISGSLAPILKALGAAPVGLSQAQTAEALQTRVIEGYVSSREVLKDLKFADTVKYVTDYPLTVNTFVAVMNQGVWNSLPADVQKVIDDLGPEMASWTGDYLDKSVKDAMDWSVKEKGLKIVALSPDEKKRWDDIIKPFEDKTVADLKAKGFPTEEYMKSLEELKQKYMK
jgi:TRAP-type C4-dicarboxylate transport system substrate-binding protein